MDFGPSPAGFSVHGISQQEYWSVSPSIPIVMLFQGEKYKRNLSFFSMFIGSNIDSVISELY